MLTLVPTSENEPAGRSRQDAFSAFMRSRKALAFLVSRHSVPADMIATSRPSGFRNSSACITWSMSRSRSKGGFMMTRS